MSDLKKELGNRIKKTRKEKNITQKELAEMVGCAEITIRQYENGRYSPKIDTRIAIAKALDTPYDCLFNPFAQLGTNLASLGTDCISRQAVLNGFCHSCDGWSCNPNTCCKTEWIRKLPVIQPGRKECEEREQGKCPWYA